MAFLVGSTWLNPTRPIDKAFRYQADHVFALPTVAFFMCGIGIFIVGHFITRLSSLRKRKDPSLLWRKALAATRYLSYRGFHIRRLRWNSAPVGILLLGAIGATYFFCKLSTYRISSTAWFTNSFATQAWIWFRSHTTGQVFSLAIHRR